MSERGFTLVEMLMVIAIIGILTTIGTFQFSSYQKKSAIDSQTRIMYGDLMELRNKALFEKSNRLFRLKSTTSYALYASEDGTATPLETKTLKMPITWNGTADIIFDTRGMLKDLSNKTICVVEENASPVDSIVVSATRIQLGKLDEGAACAANNVTAK